MIAPLHPSTKASTINFKLLFLMRIILFVGLMGFFSSLAHSQVGINTDNPRGAFEVKGSMIAEEIIFPENLPAVTEDIKKDYQLLLQNLNTHNLEILDVRENDNIGIAALVTFKLENPNGDWIQAFNTKIDASKYALVVLNGYFTDNVKDNNALPGVGAYVNSSNQWVINADYPSVNATNNLARAWVVRCSIYPKNFVKIFSQQDIDMGGKGRNENLEGTPLVN
jgi:hypothetical protein